MKKNIKLYQNHLAYSIIDHQTGKLLASAFLNEPHEYLLRSIGEDNPDKVVSVICHNSYDAHNTPRWEFRHDVDRYLRNQGDITEMEWLRRMRLTARSLIQNGADSTNGVSFDGEKSTLGELAYGI